jgi:hypothetical protein
MFPKANREKTVGGTLKYSRSPIGFRKRNLEFS